MKSIMLILCIAFLLSSCGEKKETPKVNEIEEVSATSAKETYPTAEKILLPINSSAKLFSVSTSFLDSTGKSFSWDYQFMSAETPMIYKIELDAFSVSIDSTEGLLAGASIFSQPWIDSDTAFEEAEKNGGSSFRKTHPDCKVSASLSEPVVPDSFPMWRINYKSSSEELFLVVNAVTGKVLSE